MLATIRKVTRTRDQGASAVEYGLLVAAIAALVVIIVFALGGIVQEVFKDTCDEIKAEATTVDNLGDCDTGGN
jgi:pilus assembly protein Flp/PilA